MQVKVDQRSDVLARLNTTVNEASRYFRTVDEHLFDGHQSARQALSDIVFWHREYLNIVTTMLDGEEPELREGTYEELGELATAEFKTTPLPLLCDELDGMQAKLEMALQQLPDWNVILPTKRGGRRVKVARRLTMVEKQIRQHVARLKRAERHGEAWVMAYYGGIQ